MEIFAGFYTSNLLKTSGSTQTSENTYQMSVVRSVLRLLRRTQHQGASIHRELHQSSSKPGEFLGATVGPSIAPTLVQLHKWLASIQAGRLEKPSARKAHYTDDPIEGIAESLITYTNETERRLLSKSLQEALYYSTGFEANIDYYQLKTRLSRYLLRRGAPAFIRRFLSLFFFNFVRSETGESSRRAVRSSKAFEKYVEEIDRACQQSVATVWKSFEKTRRPMDLPAAAELVSQIEQRLRFHTSLHEKYPALNSGSEVR
jgi:hypothetical protein